MNIPHSDKRSHRKLRNRMISNQEVLAEGRLELRPSPCPPEQAAFRNGLLAVARQNYHDVVVYQNHSGSQVNANVAYPSVGASNAGDESVSASSSSSSSCCSSIDPSARHELHRRRMQRRSEVSSLSASPRIDITDTGLDLKLSLKRKKNFRSMLDDLEVDLETPRYRLRAMDRRCALNTTDHPPFNPSPSLSPNLHRTSTGIEDEEEDEEEEEEGVEYKKSEPPRRRRSSRILDLSFFKSARAQQEGQQHDSNDSHNESDQSEGCEPERETFVPAGSMQKRKRRSSSILDLCLFKAGEPREVTTAPRRRSSLEQLSQRVKRSSSLLTQHVISKFKNEVFGEVTQPPQQDKEVNVLMATMLENQSKNLLNSIKNEE